MLGYPIASDATEYTLNEIANMDITGNIIPIVWLKHLTTPTGKPNLVAAFILSDIVYWYRPVKVRDEITGQEIGYGCKFKGDKLQRGYKDLVELCGYSKRQVRRALQFLENMGLIDLDYRTVVTKTGKKLSNVMFIGLNADRLREITELCEGGGTKNVHRGGTKNVHRGGTKNVHTYTENTITENTLTESFFAASADAALRKNGKSPEEKPEPETIPEGSGEDAAPILCRRSGCRAHPAKGQDLCTLCGTCVEMTDCWKALFPKRKDGFDKIHPGPYTYRKKIQTRLKSPEFRQDWKQAMQFASESPHLRQSSWFQFFWFVDNDSNWQKCNIKYYQNWDNQIARDTASVGQADVWMQVSDAMEKYGIREQPEFESVKVAKAVKHVTWRYLMELPEHRAKQEFLAAYQRVAVPSINDVLGSDI